MSTTLSNLIPWDSLPPDEQISLKERFGHYLDNLPPACSLETKIARFQYWLEEQGITYCD